MQEKDKNASTVRFLSVWGSKMFGAESMPIEDDQCDQRAPVNDPEGLYNQFVVPEDLYDELDNETIDDFDNDVYDYEDRTDLGVDIAAAQNLPKRKKKVVEKEADEKPVDEDAE